MAIYGEYNGYRYREKKVGWKRSKVIWWWFPIIWRWLPWTKYPTVNLNDDDPFEKAHELAHVPQWYKLGRLKFIIIWITQAGRLELESECTAVRIKAMVDAGGQDPNVLIAYYADIYPRSYKLNKYTISECAGAIRRHYRRLIEANG